MSYELEIECGGYSVFIEGKDRDAFERVKDVPEVEDKEILVTALLELLPPEGILSISRKNVKGELCDGPDGEPGYQQFNPEKAIARSRLVDGQMKESNQLFVVAEKHYKEGKLNDAADGTAAVQKFSSGTGRLIVKMHYQDGLLNNTPDGEAAHQEFDDSGKLTLRKYYKNGKLNDAPDGAAAWQEFNIADKQWKSYTGYYKDGEANNPSEGVPAKQWFKGDGSIYALEHYNDGKSNDLSDGTPSVLFFSGTDSSLTNAFRYANGKDAGKLKPHALRKLAKKPAVQALMKLHQ